MFNRKDLIICLLLVGMSVIWWLIPKTRKAGGNWVAAAKAVPPGCLVAYLIPLVVGAVLLVLTDRYEILSERSILNRSLMGVAYDVFGVLCGIMVVTLMVRWIWRRYPIPPEERSGCASAFLVVVLWIFVCVLYEFLFLCPGPYREPWCTRRIFKEHGVGLAYEVRAVHPFLPQHESRLRFRQDGQDTYQILSPEIGNLRRVDIYRMKDGRLLFTGKDLDEKYIVDIPEKEVFRVFFADGRFYVESLKHRNRQVVLGNELDEKVYIGCITDHFYSAEEKPEDGQP